MYASKLQKQQGIGPGKCLSTMAGKHPQQHTRGLVVSKIRAWSIIILLFLSNLFCIFGWGVAEKQVRSWQAFAVAEDSIIVQMDENIKRWLDVGCVPDKGDRI